MTYSSYTLQHSQKDLLDKSAKGEEVIIIRRGERFQLVYKGYPSRLTSPFTQVTSGLEIGDL
jgi:hypothetical protein